MIQLLGRLRPIDRKVILFYAFERKGICCNPKYMMKELIRSYPGQYELYWVSKWPDTCEEGDGYKVVRLRSLQFYKLCSYAKCFVANDRIDEFMIKRKGQIYINTWHGGGLGKKAGFDEVKNADDEAFMTKEYGKFDCFLSSGEMNAEILQRAFRLDAEHVIRSGMPRSDVLYDKTKNLEVRKKVGVASGKRIVLYAPTYRRYDSDAFFPGTEIDNLLDALGERFGGEWVFFHKIHYFEREPFYKNTGENIFDCSDYFDTQELLCAVDVLITDYSSLLWDFTLLRRPAFRYSTDIDIKVNSVSDFYLDYFKWPYPHASTVSELYDCIRKYDTEYYKARMEDYIEHYGNYDTGNSSQKAAKWIHSLLYQGKDI